MNFVWRFLISASMISAAGFFIEAQAGTSSSESHAKSIAELCEKHPEQSQEVLKMNQKLSSDGKNERREAVDYFSKMGEASVLMEIFDGNDVDLKIYTVDAMGKFSNENISDFKAELRQILSETPKWVSGTTVQNNGRRKS